MESSILLRRVNTQEFFDRKFYQYSKDFKWMIIRRIKKVFFQKSKRDGPAGRLSFFEKY